MLDQQQTVEVSNKLTIVEFVDRLKQDGFYIGKDNHIYSKKGTMISRITREGYYLARKMYDAVTHHFMEHRLIWVWHNSEIDTSKVINHLDYDRTNNHISNLELVTQKENMQYSLERLKQGVKRGPNSPTAKLSEADIMLIHHLHDSGFSNKKIGLCFPESNVNTISRVVSGTRYGNVNKAAHSYMVFPLLVEKMRNKSLTEDQELVNYALGLAGETGEVIDHIKKYVYHKHELNVNEVIKELGDCLFYIQAMANIFEIDMGEIMLNNIIKLEERYPNGFNSTDSNNRKEYENGDAH